MGLFCSILYLQLFLVVVNSFQAYGLNDAQEQLLLPGQYLPFSVRLEDASIDDLITLQANGVATSVDLVRAYVQRTYEVNDYLRAVSELNPDALDIALERDQERAAGHLRGPLHGIPVLLKDNIATTDKLNTTAGSYALVGARPSSEALVARKLRDAGAVILGKATMGEWAQYRSSFETNSHGWSPVGGQTLGAYYPQQDPHGSSSGSAVAISVGLAAGSLGTETSGSIVNPAERNNLVGIKPTLGLTSRDMVIPISARQDSVGPIAQTVKDAAHILAAISGPDTNDNWTLAQPLGNPPDYVKACNLMAFKGARLGIPRNGIEPFLTAATEPVMEAFEDALKVMSASGAYVERTADFPQFDRGAFKANSKIVLGSDFESGLTDYLEKLTINPNEIHTLRDLVDFTTDHPLEDVDHHDLLAWNNQLKRNLTSDSQASRQAYAENVQAGDDQGVLGALDAADLDALVMPTFTSFYLPSIAGLPIVTVPLGFYPAKTAIGTNLRGDLINVAPGIPFGLAFVGRKWSEETLISFAYAFEQRTMVRKQRKPLFRPTTDLHLKQSVVFTSTHVHPEEPAASQHPRVRHRPTLVGLILHRLSTLQWWGVQTFGLS